ncbi:hypothetical protein GX865_00290 [Candidatus Saccharibacteria bacterium]|jgi:DNA polymerase-4|nr:hypothetical protein [Candidatus Saccharibacteria bacterium]
MKDELNCAKPLIMHIDLNSCFATIEQQSRPLLRNRPVAVLNRRTEYTSVVTASYEAKKLGVNVGMKFRDAKLICPGIVGLESDPPKYRYVYRKLMSILEDYSAHIRMKSVDEGVIDFSQSTRLYQRADLLEVGREIKQRLRAEVGSYMRCNVGIGPSRFLAKTAANLNKPDGLTVIDHTNLRQVYSKLQLEDLTGIARGYSKRLRQAGILTPLDFLNASCEVLEEIVFKSICGRRWHQRLRGWEVDDMDYELKTVGRQFVLDGAGLGYDDILRRLHGLSEDVAIKLRSQQVQAYGVRIYAKTHHVGTWRSYARLPRPFNDEKTIFSAVKQLSKEMPLPCYEVGVTCYSLTSEEDYQLSIFLEEDKKTTAITNAIDNINKFWGDHTVHSADTLGINGRMKRKIPFGGTRYL